MGMQVSCEVYVERAEEIVVWENPEVVAEVIGHIKGKSAIARHFGCAEAKIF